MASVKSDRQIHVDLCLGFVCPLLCIVCILAALLETMMNWLLVPFLACITVLSLPHIAVFKHWSCVVDCAAAVAASTFFFFLGGLL